MIKEARTSRQRMMIFHPALAPYRIDQFNLLNELVDLEVVFLMEDLSNFNMDQQKLRDACQFRISFLLSGLCYRRRIFRFGMLRKIREGNPDIVMGFEYSLTTQYLVMLKRVGLIRQKVGSFIDDSLDICNNVQSTLRKWVRNILVKQLDFMVVMSGEVAGFYRDHLKIDEKKLIVSPILQLPERLRKEVATIESFANRYVEEYGLERKKTILFVGRFVPEKALPLFLKNIAPILVSRDDIRLVLVGEGKEREQIAMIAKEKRIEEKVILPGKYQSEELYGWYACASGFVLPSLSETFGAVVNEALIFGIKVFCSCYAGASSLVTPENGIVFNPLDSRDVHDKFQHYIDDLEAVEGISLDSKPPLMEEQRHSFLQEWKKILYTEML
ncbi:MAG: glycosyltransferase family 4 protein [Proteiniphilum sp.]